MSAQLPDRLVFQGREHDIVSASPTPLFEPGRWGLDPVSPHGACLRGTLATFLVKGEKLYLTTLSYWTRQSVAPSLAEGTILREEELSECSGYRYQWMNAPVAWSGKIVIGRSFLWNLLLPRGFQPAWKYREVTELLFEKGRLRAFSDTSRRMADLRAHVVETAYAVGL